MRKIQTEAAPINLVERTAAKHELMHHIFRQIDIIHLIAQRMGIVANVKPRRFLFTADAGNEFKAGILLIRQ